MPNPSLLDCTVRDGSYVIQFQWTEEDVQSIVSLLADAGVEYMEVGHGLGLGATHSRTPSLISDERYVRSAVEVKAQSKIGAFFIPGIGSREDLVAFQDYGGDFIRIGTNATESEQAIPFVERAKELGLEVSYNFMKSYVLSPYEICRRSKQLEDHGADIVYLVDSAGGMLPRQVGQYVSLLKECLGIRVGFHGHNNLLMANANSLAAVEAGADLIDATMLGMGRGAGNAQTESLLVVLAHAGFDLGIDPLRIARFSARCIAEKSPNLKGADGLELLQGIAFFHDAFLTLLRDCAAEYEVDFETLVLEVSEVNKQNPSEDLVRTIATQLRDSQSVNLPEPKFHHREIR